MDKAKLLEQADIEEAVARHLLTFSEEHPLKEDVYQAGMVSGFRAIALRALAAKEPLRKELT